MENILEKIVANKRKEVKARKKIISMSNLSEFYFEVFVYDKTYDTSCNLSYTPPIWDLYEDVCKCMGIENFPKYRKETLSLKEALLAGKAKGKTPHIPGVIAEFKRKSPSKGVINAEARVEDVIPSYAENGAAACSVLADHEFFGGSLNDVATACKVLRENGSSQRDIPILFKEFVIIPRQIFEARILGADAILLIASVSDVQWCETLAKCAHMNGMEVLLEIHSEEELDHLSCEPDVVGINNRDLTTFNTEISNSLKLAERIMERCRREAPSAAIISESGIKGAEDMKTLSECGFDGFLIGETFMRSPNPGAKLKELLSEFSQKF